MKSLLTILVTLFAIQTWAVEEPNFICQIGGQEVKSIPGLKKAPESPVVELSIKVIKEQVPLYVMKATFNEGEQAIEKDIFVTDWTTKSNLSDSGAELLDLLAFFYGYDIDNVTELRAAIPANILEDFAYLELKFADGSVTKLGFEGINPTECN